MSRTFWRGLTVLISLFAITQLGACSRSESNDEDTGIVDKDTGVEQDTVTNQDTTIPSDQTGGMDKTTPNDVTIPDGTRIMDLQKNAQGLACDGEDFINLSDSETLEGVIVTAPVFSSSGSMDAFFVQDPAGGPHSGMKVIVAAGTAPALALGDVITLTGSVKEFYCVTEMEAASIQKTGTAAIPTPEVVTSSAIAAEGADSEQWEGVLVQVQDTKVESVDNYGGVILVGGAYIDSDIFDGWTRPSANCQYAMVAGVLDYSFNQYRLLPRDAADLELDDSVPCEGGGGCEAMSIVDVQASTESTTCTTEAFVNVGCVGISGAIVMSPRLDVSNNKFHGFFVSDGVGGMNSAVLMLTEWSADAQYAIGDVLSFDGDWTEYYCLTELKAKNIEKTGTTPVADIPVTSVTEADITMEGDSEAYEGVLVTLADVTIATVNEYDEAETNGGVYIDDDFGFDTSVLVAGKTFSSITGVIYYSYSKYRLLPRFDEDLVE